MSHKGKWLFWVFATLVILMIALAGTGAILEWVLPHGDGGRGMGHNRARNATLIGIPRHLWGEIHFYVGLIFVGVVLVHVLFHVGWIKASFKRNVTGR